MSNPQTLDLGARARDRGQAATNIKRVYGDSVGGNKEFIWETRLIPVKRLAMENNNRCSRLCHVEVALAMLEIYRWGKADSVARIFPEVTPISIGMMQSNILQLHPQSRIYQSENTYNK